MSTIFTVVGLFGSIAVNSEEPPPESISVMPRQMHTRSLAASCAACHGTNGNSIGDTGKLAGKDKSEFIKKMLGFKSGEFAATVMHHHAKGLNAQEIADLADYFSTQIPHKSVYLVPQKLYKNASN